MLQVEYVMKIRKACFLGAALSVLASFFLGCGAAVLSDEGLARQAGAQFEEMKRRDRVSPNTDYKAMIERIGKRITDVAEVDVPGTEWEFVVFDKPEPNAFAMPGGKVGVNTGLIDLANGNEDQIAAVIGHEVAHVAFRHSNKRMTQAMGLTLGGVILDVAMRDKDRKDRRIARAAYGVGSTVGLMLPYSRQHESEADHRGLYYSAMAGYDPRGSVTFWKKMNERNKGRMPAFLSTHPDPGRRIEDLQANMPRALDLYREAKRARGEVPNP